MQPHGALLSCRPSPSQTVFTAKDIEAWSMTYGAGTLYVGYQGKNSLQSRGGILMCAVVGVVVAMASLMESLH
jgi:hypothetical protein